MRVRTYLPGQIRSQEVMFTLLELIVTVSEPIIMAIVQDTVDRELRLDAKLSLCTNGGLLE